MAGGDPHAGQFVQIFIGQFVHFGKGLLIEADGGAERARALSRPLIATLRAAVGLRSLASQDTGAKQAKAVEKKPANGTPMAVQRIVSHVQGQLGAPVSIKADATGKGTLTIRFKDDRDLERVLSILDLLP